MASGQQWVLVEMVQAFYEVRFVSRPRCRVELFSGAPRDIPCAVSATGMCLVESWAQVCKVDSQEVA